VRLPVLIMNDRKSFQYTVVRYLLQETGTKTLCHFIYGWLAIITVTEIF